MTGYRTESTWEERLYMVILNIFFAEIFNILMRISVLHLMSYMSIIDFVERKQLSGAAENLQNRCQKLFRGRVILYSAHEKKYVG